MACWPSYITALASFALLFYDLFTENWKDLPIHAAAGILLSGLLYAVCLFLGTAISASLLLIPTLFVIGFFFAIWYTGEELRKRGCCVSCNQIIQPSCLEPKEPCLPSRPPTPLTPTPLTPKLNVCEPGLKATPVV